MNYQKMLDDEVSEENLKRILDENEMKDVKD